MANLAAKRPMQILATGTWKISPRPASSGFTLVEILVVLVKKKGVDAVLPPN